MRITIWKTRSPAGPRAQAEVVAGTELGDGYPGVAWESLVRPSSLVRVGPVLGPVMPSMSLPKSATSHRLYKGFRGVSGPLLVSSHMWRSPDSPPPVGQHVNPAYLSTPIFHASAYPRTPATNNR